RRGYNMTISYSKKFGVIFLAPVFAWLVMSMGWTDAALGVTKKGLRRVNDQGAVEVSVVYLNPIQPAAGSHLSFEARLETHSVSLDAYKMEKISFIRFDNSSKQPALGWFEPGGGGHHISGILKFSGPVPDGTKSIKVIIEGIDGVQKRIFEWKLPIE
ncbi:MAG: hypothetical protein ACE5DO_05895, partial [Desulfobacterales bacterium]